MHVIILVIQHIDAKHHGNTNGKALDYHMHVMITCMHACTYKHIPTTTPPCALEAQAPDTRLCYYMLIYTQANTHEDIITRIHALTETNTPNKTIHAPGADSWRRA